MQLQLVTEFVALSHNRDTAIKIKNRNFNKDKTFKNLK
jgi:hypothetical protein